MEQLMSGTRSNSTHRSSGSSHRTFLCEDQRMIQVWREFSSALKVYSIIAPTPQPEQEHQPRRDTHGIYLDNLALLADHKPAGRTVTAVAIQDCSQTPIYWLAANNGVSEGAIAHLTWVLEQLQSLSLKSSPERANIETAIAEQSITRAHSKVKNYRDRLSSYVKKLLETLREEPGDGLSDVDYDLLVQRIAHDIDTEDRTEKAEMLTNVLIDWHSRSEQPIELCKLAREFGKTEPFTWMKQYYKHSNGGLPWFWIHHYIGRLGSWHRAAQILAHIVNHTPTLVAKFSVKPVRGASSMVFGPCELSLHDVIKRAVPLLSIEGVVSNLDALLDKESSNPAGTLQERYSRRQRAADSIAHAECILAEHFYQADFKFLYGNRYIGCSKRVCYSCNLYLQNHPGQFKFRPSSKSVWCHWTPPHTHQTPKDNQLFHTISAMNNSLCDDIEKRILSPDDFRGKPPDSMTVTTHIFATQVRRERNSS